MISSQCLVLTSVTPEIVLKMVSFIDVKKVNSIGYPYYTLLLVYLVYCCGLYWLYAMSINSPTPKSVISLDKSFLIGVHITILAIDTGHTQTLGFSLWRAIILLSKPLVVINGGRGGLGGRDYELQGGVTTCYGRYNHSKMAY